MRARSTILLTGFGPFPGVPLNATAELVPRLTKAALSLVADHDVVGAILPTDWDEAPARLAKLLDQSHVVLALHFGAARDAEGFRIELVGRNQQTATPDAAGKLPKGNRVIEAGPELLESTLPAERIVARLLGLGFPCRTSSNAGTYLCNALLYHSLSAARARAEPFLAGFVHLPVHLTGCGADGREPHPECPLDWRTAVAGGLEIIHACLEHISGPQPPVKAG